MVHGKCLVTDYSLSNPGVASPISSLIACLDEVLMKMEKCQFHSKSDQNLNLKVHSGVPWKHHQNWRIGGSGLVANPCSCLTLATLWGEAHQAALSRGFPRQEYWSGLSFPSPGDLPDLGIKPRSPKLQTDSLLTESPGNWRIVLVKSAFFSGRCVWTENMAMLFGIRESEYFRLEDTSDIIKLYALILRIK